MSVHETVNRLAALDELAAQAQELDMGYGRTSRRTVWWWPRLLAGILAARVFGALVGMNVGAVVLWPGDGSTDQAQYWWAGLFFGAGAVGWAWHCWGNR